MKNALEIFCLVFYIVMLIIFAVVAAYSLNRFFDDPSTPEWLIAALLALIAMAN